MARILPDTPPRSASSEVVKVYQALKRLPDDYEVWHNMGFQKQKAPDFLLVRKGCALLVMVSAATAHDAQFASQITFLQEEKAPMGKPEEEILSTFISSLDLPDHRIGSVVLFPHISGEQLKKSGAAKEPPSGIHWVGRDPLQAEPDRSWEDFLPPDPLDDLLLEKLRQRFTPEIGRPRGHDRPAQGRAAAEGGLDRLPPGLRPGMGGQIGPGPFPGRPGCQQRYPPEHRQRRGRQRQDADPALPPAHPAQVLSGEALPGADP